MRLHNRIGAEKIRKIGRILDFWAFFWWARINALTLCFFCKNRLISSIKYIIFIVSGVNRDKKRVRNPFDFKPKVSAAADEVAADDSAWRNYASYPRAVRDRKRYPG